MKKINEEDRQQAIINAINASGGMQIDNTMRDDGMIFYAATINYQGTDYRCECAFPREEYDRIMDAYAGDEGALPWDEVEYTVYELEN